MNRDEYIRQVTGRARSMRERELAGAAHSIGLTVEQGAQWIAEHRESVRTGEIVASNHADQWLYMRATNARILMVRKVRQRVQMLCNKWGCGETISFVASAFDADVMDRYIFNCVQGMPVREAWRKAYGDARKAR